MKNPRIVIGGVTYERDLVEEADKAPKPIGMNTALKLWHSALDGSKITETEGKTLKCIADGFRGAITPEAKAWILKKIERWAARVALVQKKPGGKAARGTRTLKDYGGIKVDAALLEHADDCNMDGKTISFDDAEDLIDNAMDGKRITKTEQTTLEHIVKHYKVEERAKSLLSNAMSALLDMHKYAGMLTGDEALVLAENVLPVAPSPDGAYAAAIMGIGMMSKPDVEAAIPRKVLEGKLDEIFKKCDTAGDGKINKTVLIQACKSDPHLAGFFSVAQSIRTEDGQMEKILLSIEKASSKTITKDEFFKFFSGEAISSPTEEPGAKRPRVDTEVKPLVLASADPSSYQVSGGTGYKPGMEVKPPESYLPAPVDPSSYQVSGGTGYTEVKPPESYLPASADPSSYGVSAPTGYKGGAGTEVKEPASYQVPGGARTEHH